MKNKKLMLFVLSACFVLMSHAAAFADPIEDVLRIWQETIWNWGSRVFWFFGVAAAIVMASSPSNRKKAMYVLGGVILFYITPLIIEVVEQATGTPF
jgi:hypothetical protein